jgi:hypothetical protein
MFEPWPIQRLQQLLRLSVRPALQIGSAAQLPSPIR